MAVRAPRDVPRHVAWVIAAAIVLPALALSTLSLQAIQEDRRALAALGAKRARQAVRSAQTMIEEELATRARGALRRAVITDASPRGGGARLADALRAAEERVRTAEPLVRGLLALSPSGRLLFPRPPRPPGDLTTGVRTDDEPLSWLPGQDGRAGALADASARVEARAVVASQLEETCVRETTGALQPTAARRVLRDLALNPSDPEVAARARLALARSLARSGRLAPAITHLDLLSRIDPRLRTPSGLSIAAGATVRAVELRAARDPRRGLRAATEALRALADDRLPISDAEAEVLAQRLLVVAEKGAGLGALEAIWQRHRRERAYAAELTAEVLPDLRAVTRAGPAAPGIVDLVAIMPRRAVAARARAATAPPTAPGTRSPRARLVAYRPVDWTPSTGGERVAVLGAELDLDRAVPEIVLPVLRRVSQELNVRLELRASHGRVLARAAPPAATEAAPTSRGAPAQADEARRRLERVLPAWTITARPAPDPEGARRLRLRFLMQAGMVALLLALVALGGVWTLRAVRRAVRLAELETELVSRVSHELRTPLTSIRLYVDMLRQGRATTDERRGRYLDTISDQAARLEQLITGLLDFARCSEAEARPGAGASAPDALVRDALAAIQPQGEAGGFAIAEQVPDALPEVAGDPEALVICLKNLLQNAIKYSPPDRRHIRIEAAREGAGVAFTVRDEGYGIDPADLPRVFERFFRGRGAAAEAQPGSGLGLALVRRVVERSGGRCRAESAPGRGSTFTIWLPPARRLPPAPPAGDAETPVERGVL